MRLIDADAIPYREIWREDWLNNAGKYQQGVFRDEIEEMPAVDAVPVRHGKWIDEGQYADYHPHHAWRCSECGEHVLEIGVPWFKYCPNCGARMDEE